MNIKVRQNVLPLITAAIWGTAFVAQSVSADKMGGFMFTAARSLIAAVFLAVLIFVCDRTGLKKLSITRPNVGTKKDLIVGGICCGTALFVATNLQQYGIKFTSVGKAGFITALYIVLVPVGSMFFGKKSSIGIWVSVLIATVGLYLLCMNEKFTVSKGDALVFLCAIAFTAHILIIDRFTNLTDGVRLSLVQFITCFVLSIVCAFLFEKNTVSDIISCIWPIIYVGVFSSGIAYTLQIVAQRGSNPAVVSLLLSLESVFSVVSGAIILGERLKVKEYIGCVFMLAAVILAQLPAKKAVK